MEPGERVDRESKAGSAAEALRSQFVFVVLGLVIEEPGYGYALWQRFESRFGGFYLLDFPELDAEIATERIRGFRV